MWHISRVDGLKQVLVGQLPIAMSEKEVLEVLRSLYCAALSPREIFASSLRKGYKGRTKLLDQIGNGLPLQIGDVPCFIAERID